MFPIYTKTRISDSLYSIAERHSEHGMTAMMYLVIGSERAALIDSGFGLTDTLRDIVEEITPLPVICLVAHGHPDHVGAAALFDKVCMSRRDKPLLPISLSAGRRLEDAEHGGASEELLAHMREHIVMPEKRISTAGQPSGSAAKRWRSSRSRGTPPALSLFITGGTITPLQATASAPGRRS